MEIPVLTGNSVPPWSDAGTNTAFYLMVLLPIHDLVYRFRKNVGKSNFSEQFRKLINRYKKNGCSLNIMRQTACLVVNPIIVDGYASLFNCTTAVRASDSMTASS